MVEIEIAGVFSTFKDEKLPLEWKPRFSNEKFFSFFFHFENGKLPLGADLRIF